MDEEVTRFSYEANIKATAKTTPKILSVRSLMPLTVDHEWPDGNKGSMLVFLDLTQGRVLFPFRPGRAMDEEQFSSDIIGWLNGRPQPDVEVPLELYEAIERSQNVEYNQGVPYA